jgi:O-antigen ligase
LHVVLQIVLLTLFIFAALSYGAVHYWAYSIVFGVTFLLCAMVFLQSGLSFLRSNRRGENEWSVARSPFRGPFVFFLAAFMGFVLLQLAPLSNSFLKVLSPYTAYLYGQAHDLTAYGTGGGIDPGSLIGGYLSLDRDKTVKSLLTFAAYLGFAFLVTRAIRGSRDANQFTLVLIIFSVGLSLYGLLSLFYASPKIAGWKNPLGSGARVSATLVNPDHFGSYLLMAIYLTFGYLTVFLKKLPPTEGRSRFQRGVSILSAEESYVPKAFLLLFLMAVMVVVLLYTLSRGAVIGFAVSMAFCFLLLFLKTRRPVFLLLMIPPAVLVGYYIQVVGADPLLQRLEDTRKDLLQLDDNLRVQFYRAGLELWRKFPLFGSGLGSFEVVYSITVPQDSERSYLPYIHNDWLQLAIETGWIGGVLFILAMGSVFVAMVCRWWQARGPWGFGFGLAAISAMVGTGIHAFFDFGLRIPVNAIFLVLLASLAMVTLDEDFERNTRQHRAGLFPQGIRLLAGFSLLIGAIVSVWLSVQTGRYALAQHDCPTEIDTVSRREYKMSASKLQRALQLNPLNGEYWLSLAMFEDLGDSKDIPKEEAAVGLDQSPIDPNTIPYWEGKRVGRESLRDWAYARALTCSPASSQFWFAWADHLREKLQSGEGWEGKLPGLTAQCYNIALELHPYGSSVHQRAADFFLWQRQKDLPGN